MVQTSDELRQPPGTDPFWADAWEIDFAGRQPDGTAVGGFVRLTLLPNQGVAWWWTSLLTPRLVAVRDHEVPLPRAGLEVRADGLWGELVCETPLEHWGIGLEAFGLGYDDLADAWGDEWGDRIPVGLDLEWEVGPEARALPRGRQEGSGGGPVNPGPVPPAGPGSGPGSGGIGYAHPGHVHGEILVGQDRIPFDGSGFRSRSSGVLDWWSGSHRRLAWVTATGAAGVVIGPAAHAAAVVLGQVPVLVTADGRPTIRLARALCRVDGPAGVGSAGGFGWAEWFPAAGPELPAFLTNDGCS